MSDLISRNEALALIESMMETYWDRKQILNVVRSNIEKLPSADPKKGKWVDIVEMDSGGYPFKVGLCCSVCGAPTLSDDNYCPHCGAKMEVTE